jgi:predicted transport protein
MAYLKLFQIQGTKVNIKTPTEFKYEREIQKLCEENLETLFGIRFIATEHSTGSKHKGRIDSLGIDENNCPIIVEYKLDSKDNVINQGLFYLDWLMDHKADFEMLCLNKFSKQTEVDWTNPRLLCIAKDFTKYDDYAIAQINRNIELIRYRVFDEDHILFELASTTQQKESADSSVSGQNKYKGIDDYKKSASDELILIYQEVEDFIFSLGDDVQKKELKFYYAYSRIKNFVCLEIRPQKKNILVFLKIDYTAIQNPAKNVRDVSKIGHYGTGDTEVSISTIEDFEKARIFIEKSYNQS